METENKQEKQVKLSLTMNEVSDISWALTGYINVLGDKKACENAQDRMRELRNKLWDIADRR